MWREIVSMASEVIHSIWDTLKCGPVRPGAMSSLFQLLNTPTPSCFYRTDIFCIVNCLHLVMIAPTRCFDMNMYDLHKKSACFDMNMYDLHKKSVCFYMNMYDLHTNSACFYINMYDLHTKSAWRCYS